MERNRPHYDSTYSYFPEMLAHYGRNDRPYKSILEIAVEHRGTRGTSFTNQAGPPLKWRPDSKRMENALRWPL
jgi:hypothetical protein